MCYFTYPLWYKFANKYSTQKLKFVEIDIIKFPWLAKQFKISTSVSEHQLPTVVLLEDWNEYLRFPTVDEKGRQGRILAWKERELNKYFDLEQRHAATRHLT